MNDKINSSIDFIRLIENIVRNEFICSKSTKKFISFKENDSQAKTKEIKIRKLNEKESTQFVCLGIVPLPANLECCPNGFFFFNQKLYPLIKTQIPGFAKSPDGIMLVANQDEPNKLLILLIELKSDKDDGWLKQTYGGIVITRNLVDIASLHKEIDEVFLKNLSINYLAMRYGSNLSTQPLPLEEDPKFEIIDDEIIKNKFELKFITNALPAEIQYRVEHFWNNFFSPNLNA